MVAVLNWCLVNWWVFFFLAFLGVFDGIQNFFIGIAEAIGHGIGARRQDAPAVAAPAAAALPVPGECVHRNVKQVRTTDGELVGWQCQHLGCEDLLPPGWAVAAEDLPAPGAEPPSGWVK
jgi:hypothetical protein